MKKILALLVIPFVFVATIPQVSAYSDVAGLAAAKTAEQVLATKAGRALAESIFGEKRVREIFGSGKSLHESLVAELSSARDVAARDAFLRAMTRIEAARSERNLRIGDELERVIDAERVRFVEEQKAVAETAARVKENGDKPATVDALRMRARAEAARNSAREQFPEVEQAVEVMAERVKTGEISPDEAANAASGLREASSAIGASVAGPGAKTCVSQFGVPAVKNFVHMLASLRNVVFRTAQDVFARLIETASARYKESREAAKERVCHLADQCNIINSRTFAAQCAP